MELQLFGINHKTSNVSEREQFIINESNQILLNTFLKENDVSFKEFIDEIWLSPFTGTITGNYDPLIDEVVYNLKMTYDPSLIDKSEQEGKDWDRSSQRD